MKKLKNYIKESLNNELLKLYSEDLQKLLDFDLEYGKIMIISRYETSIRTIDNLDELWKQFKDNYLKNGKKTNLKIKHLPLEYKKYDLENRCNMLIEKFSNLNCILSKYYIKSLESIIDRINTIESVKNNTYKIPDSKIRSIKPDILEKALNIAKEQKFTDLKDVIKTDPDYERNITGNKIKKIISDKLKELDYDWEVIENNNMPPRMGVNPEKTFRIRTTARFSNVDVESLIAHEIKAHVAKRNYGYNTGLFLFVFGLPGRNLFDEGLAIWNSLNLIEKPKPNVIPGIAFSYISCYYASKYDFYECFEKLKTLYEGQAISDNRIFKQLMRLKRSTGKIDLLGFWGGDKDYFEGYLLVDKMNTEERNTILKWNVGIDNYYDIPMFESFIKINNLQPISNERLSQITKDYKFKY